MSERGKESLSRISFLISTVASIIAGAISLVSYSGFKKLFPLLSNIPFIVWLIFVLFIYTIICFIEEKKQSPNPKLRKLFRIPQWSELRTFGEQKFAKLSYYALIVIPFITYCYGKKILGFSFSNYISFPENLKLTYFSSWAIAIALLVFSISCPKDLRKPKIFDKVRTVNLVLNNVNEAKIIVQQEEPKDDPILDQSSLLLRTICFFFYSTGIMILLIILFKSATLVLNAT